jgi:hypothetical protein
MEELWSAVLMDLSRSVPERAFNLIHCTTLDILLVCRDAYLIRRIRDPTKV